MQSARRNTHRDEIYEAAPAGPPQRAKKAKTIEALQGYQPTVHEPS